MAWLWHSSGFDSAPAPCQNHSNLMPDNLSINWPLLIRKVEKFAKSKWKSEIGVVHWLRNNLKEQEGFRILWWFKECPEMEMKVLKVVVVRYVMIEWP